MDNKSKTIMQQFSKYLFWDVDINDIDLKKHSKFVIERVLIYGLFSDFKLIMKYYGLHTIAEKAKTSKQIDKKTASFISNICGVDKNEFLCYTTKQSTQKHWNF